MDSEAASRGTTVYLVDKRIDMLPALLGTNLCSLRPFVERLAFSAIWELTPEGEIVSTRFTKSVIASKEAFTYQAAQDRKDNKALQDPLTQGIRLLNTLAIKLKEGRMRAGALSLSSPELKIHLDTNEGAPEPIDVEQKQQLETNSLVEEFMLLANISVAKKIQEAYPQTAVLRRHLPPPKTNFETLQDILQKKKGMTLDVTSSKALAESLDRCVVSTTNSSGGHADPFADPLGAGIQHAGANHGDAMYAGGRVLLLGQCIERYLRALWSGQSHLHAFHSKPIPL